MNYTYFYKYCYSNIEELSSLPNYDLFISSYVNSERVLGPAGVVPAEKKIWFVTESDNLDLYLAGKEIVPAKANEDNDPILNKLRELQITRERVCIDATGFKIPYLMYLIRCMGIFTKKFDIIYTEPTKYRCASNTQFSDQFYEVKQINGMAGLHTSKNEKDLLIIAAGYDHSRIVDVANKKRDCKKVLLFGFPSISPSMFQENILRVYEAEASIGTECFRNMDYNIYAPAYDPFVTAQTISEYINRHSVQVPFTNIYLAPLSTKPHAIGMALYFLWEQMLNHQNISLIYPYCQQYIVDNSDGIARIWRYKIELP